MSGEPSSHARYVFLTSLAKPETKKALPLALMRCLKRPFLLAVIPRLFLICFRYSQPILIRKAIRYVVVLSADPGGSRGFWLIISAVVVYVGLAVSSDFELTHPVLTYCIRYLPLCTKTG